MIKNTLKKIIRWAVEERDSMPAEINKLAVRPSDGPDIEGMRFTLMRATGGIILQGRNYDHRKDQHNTTTYIITDDEPLAERIGQIVSMEILRL